MLAYLQSLSNEIANVNCYACIELNTLAKTFKKVFLLN